MNNSYNNKIDIHEMICHSGGAIGSDSFFEKNCLKYGIRVKAYSYKTKYHTSINKIEISDDEYIEGINQIKKANKVLKRYNIRKYYNLLSRNWPQVKHTEQIFAIGHIINPGDKNTKGYYNNSEYQIVDGGTGYAVQMGINNNKEIFVFDQIQCKWYRFSYINYKFIEIKESPIISEKNFTGIGTRYPNEFAIKAIDDLFVKTFGY